MFVKIQSKLRVLFSINSLPTYFYLTHMFFCFSSSGSVVNLGFLHHKQWTVKLLERTCFVYLHLYWELTSVSCTLDLFYLCVGQVRGELYHYIRSET